jgi:GAG-pre-integrase domain
MIVNHQLYPHIAPPVDPNAPWDPMEMPVYRPPITPTSTREEMEDYGVWYGRERMAVHIITSSISASILPTIALRGPSGSRLTVREVLGQIDKTYGVADFSSAMVVMDELERLSSANLGVRGFIDAFCGKFNTLVQAKYPYDGRTVLRSFMRGLPSNDLNWHAFCDNLNDLVTTRFPYEFPALIVQAFSSANARLLSLENSEKMCRGQQPASSGKRSGGGASGGGQTGTAKASTDRMSSVCSNCKKPGHEVATCWGPGGPMYGRQDEAMRILRDRKKDKPDAPSKANVAAPAVSVQKQPSKTDASQGAAQPTPSSIPHFAAPAYVPPDSPHIELEYCSNYTIFDLYFPPFGCLEDDESESPSEAFIMDPSSSPSSALHQAVVPESSQDLRDQIFPSEFNAMLDSGCSNHIFNDPNQFSSLDLSFRQDIGTANMGSFVVQGRGDVIVKMYFDGREVRFCFVGCFFYPGTPIHLILVGALNEKGFNIRFSHQLVGTISFSPNHPQFPGRSIMATYWNWLYFLYLNFVSALVAISSASLATPFDPSPHHHLAFVTLPVDGGDEVQGQFRRAVSAKRPQPLTVMLWHRRAGHVGMEALYAWLTKNYVNGIDFVGKFPKHPCTACIIGKHPQQPYPSHNNRTEHPLDLTHMDNAGPFRTRTPDGKHYFFALLDNSSSRVEVFLLSERSEVLEKFKKYKAWWENELGRKMKAIQIDGVGEFAHMLKAFCEEHGISVRLTPPHSHSSNGKAERMIRTLEDGMLTQLADSMLPFTYWGWSVLSFAYVRNHLPTSTLPLGMTP